MLLYAKKLIVGDYMAFDKALAEWLEFTVSLDGILKTWFAVDHIDPGSVRTRVRYGQEILDEKPIYIDEPTYIDSSSASLFSLNKASLGACAEILRKHGETKEQPLPVFNALDDLAVVERTMVYDPQQKAYVQTIYDPPRNKKTLLHTLNDPSIEVEGFVFRSGNITSAGIALTSIGVYGDCLELYIADKHSGYSIELNSKNEKIWANNVVDLLNRVLPNPTAVVK